MSTIVSTTESHLGIEPLSSLPKPSGSSFERNTESAFTVARTPSEYSFSAKAGSSAVLRISDSSSSVSTSETDLL